MVAQTQGPHSLLPGLVGIHRPLGMLLRQEMGSRMTDTWDALQSQLTEQYAAWRTNPAVDFNDPTVKYLAELAQSVIALAAISPVSGCQCGRKQ